MKNIAIIFYFLVILLISCRKQESVIDPFPYLLNKWEPMIDSLNGEHFENLEIDENQNYFINIWKGWNGSGPTQRPTTLISKDGLSWRTTDIGVDHNWTYLKRHKNLIFAGTSGEGLFVSADNGYSWNKVTGYPNIWPKTIETDNNKIIISDYGTYKTYISEDDGTTWKEIYSNYFNSISMINNKIVCGIGCNLIKSNDWGKSWTIDSSLRIQLKKNDIFINYSIVNNKEVIGLGHGIFMKENDSVWTKIDNLINEYRYNYMFFDNKNVIIQNTDMKIFYSNNLGKDWYPFEQGIKYTYWMDKIIRKGSYIYMSHGHGFYKRKVE